MIPNSECELLNTKNAKLNEQRKPTEGTLLLRAPNDPRAPKWNTAILAICIEMAEYSSDAKK